MSARPYAPYDVMAKRRTVSFDEVTRGVIDRRLHAAPGRRFFAAEDYRLLEALCARLIPQPDRDAPIPIAPWIDADLHEGRGEGFRHPSAPPLRETWRRGLAGIEAHARARYGRSFVELAADLQDATLASIQAGDAKDAPAPAADDGPDGPPLAHFFTQVLLKAAAGVYYSHPDAWSEIGFGGPASPRGYVRTSLDRRDPWEAPLAPASESPPGDPAGDPA